MLPYCRCHGQAVIRTEVQLRSRDRVAPEVTWSRDRAAPGVTLPQASGTGKQASKLRLQLTPDFALCNCHVALRATSCR